MSCSRTARQFGFTLIELLVVIAIMVVLIALLLPAVQSVRMAALRTRTTNNLHQCSLAALAFHDANGWLPYNGTNTGRGVTDSGSWAYQILPYIEQQAVFDSQTSTTPITTLLDPMRPRPGYFTSNLVPTVKVTSSGSGTPSITVVGVGSTGTLAITPTTVAGRPVSVTVTITPSGGSIGTVMIGATNYQFADDGTPVPRPAPLLTATTATIKISASYADPDSGPATDFGINPYLNVPQSGASSGGTVNAMNNHHTLIQIVDGTSNTILLCEMYCAIADYPLTQASFVSSRLGTPPATTTLVPIFQGGTWATTRNGLGSSTTTWLQDGQAATANQWGSPLSYGGLMAMADGSVHLIPYTMSLQYLLEPNDGNAVEVP